MTIEGIRALNLCDAVLVLDKGDDKRDLTRLRREIVDRFASDRQPRWIEAASPVRDAANVSYRAGVDAWHAAKAEAFKALLCNDMRAGETGAILVWGDPSLYDSTIRILEMLADNGDVLFTFEVIPGVSSLHTLTARHGIALNTIGDPVLITTGRKLAERMPEDVETIVVMLDGGAGLEAVAGRDFDIYWGAYLGTPDEALISGHVGDVLDAIKRRRSELRKAKGWIMDIYLLRRAR